MSKDQRISEQIKKRRDDKWFMKRLRRSIEENKELLDRLKDA